MKAKKMPVTNYEELIPMLIGIWRKLLKTPGPQDKLQTREFRSVVSALVKLQDGVIHGDSLIDQNYFSEKSSLGAYLLYQLVIHYQQGISLINELPHTPKKVLDLCSGPGAFSLAALKHGAEEVIAVDKSQEALEMAAQVCGRCGYPLTIRRMDILNGLHQIENGFDLIILGHCLNELFPTSDSNWREKQKNFIDILLKKLNSNGYLLIVDSSLSEPNKCVLQLRDALVSQGVAIQAPCVWQGACPVLSQGGAFQCYAQRPMEKPFLIKELQRAANINLSSLKMSYLIVRSPESHWPKLPDSEGSYWRVISPPVESYRSERYFLCGTEGKIKLGSRLQEHPKESRAFEYLQRGDLLNIVNPLIQGDVWEITEDTKVTIAAAISKPLLDVDSTE